MRILCYGDSNTYGYDPRSCLGGRYPASVRWTALLNAGEWEIVNEGENGRCIPRSAGEIGAAAEAVRRSGAEALTVMLGANDLLQRPGLPAEACEERMERFLTALFSELSAPVRTLLTAPPPLEPGAWVSAPEILRESRRLAERCAALAERLGIGFADAGAWGVELAYDGVHFSEAGHRAFAAGMRRALEDLLRSTA